MYGWAAGEVECGPWTPSRRYETRYGNGSERKAHQRFPAPKAASPTSWEPQPLLKRWPGWMYGRRPGTLKCNPDMPQRPVRKRALEEGKVLYMPVPRLTSEECFLELDPARIEDLSFASSIKGAFTLGRPVHPRDMAKIDLIVCGAVAARPDGSRLGKGGGYSDLEYALALSLGLISHETPVATTVHPIQLVEAPIPMTRHDLSLDYVVTQREVIRCTPSHPRPQGIYPEELGDKRDEIPILNALIDWTSQTGG